MLRPGPCPPILARGLALVLCLALAPGCGGGGNGGERGGRERAEGEDGHGGARRAHEDGGGQQAKSPDEAVPGEIRTQMRDVLFRVDPVVVLEIRTLAGKLVPTREGEAPYFDDPSSFALAIDGAEIALSPESLAGILNRYAFAYEGAPLSDLSVEIRDGMLYQEGTLDKAGGIPFSVLGRISATPSGDVQLEPVEMHAADLPIENLMDLIGLELAQVVNAEEARGVRIDEDTILLDPERLLPPPAIRGRVSRVRLEPDRIVQVFGSGSGDAGLRPPVPDRGHMFFRGNVLRFGKLTMTGTDLEIADADPSDPFEFYLEEYQKQLTAGYSKTLADAGLVSYMPDYSEAASTDLP